MASSQALPEPMNSSPHHSKVKVTITLPDPTFVAGAHVSGKMEMECRADRGLGIGIMMVELFAIQELTSRDHSATSTFLHTRRLFQGEGLPPSNAVQAHTMPGDPPLPQHYYQARRGRSTFLFHIPIPASSPSALSFGSGLAKVRYELRASVGVYWKNEKRLVIDKHDIDVVESFPYNDVLMGKIPEAIVVGENGKIWMQGRIVGSVVEAGGVACLELQVKNHSNKKNSGLTLALTRTLYLTGSTTGQQAPVQISDTLTTVPFRGPEYIIPPGAEGIANLVFDVPKHARGVRGGTLDGDGDGPRYTESLFEIRCNKDILLEVPVEIIHPLAMPPVEQVPGPYAQSYSAPEPSVAVPPVNSSPYFDYNAYYAAHPMSPAPAAVPMQNQVWLPPPPSIPLSSIPPGYPYASPSPFQPESYQPVVPPYTQPYYTPQSPLHQQQSLAPPLVPVGSVGAGPSVVTGLPPPSSNHLLPLNEVSLAQAAVAAPLEPEVGKGERASRIAQHLRISHRYPLPGTLLHVNESYVRDISSVAAPSRPIQIRQLPHPPGLSRGENLSLSPPTAEAMLTPKHSFTRDPVLGTMSKSERVEELEKMAAEVNGKSQDLSGDLPREALQRQPNENGNKGKAHPVEVGFNVNKTLPGPPVPSGKFISHFPSRARADQYFANQDRPLLETAPLPSDQTPPTPALLAVLPSRRNDRNELRAESGLDALERRLLAEVGTRKFDTNNDPRPGLNAILPIDTDSVHAEQLPYLFLQGHKRKHGIEADNTTAQMSWRKVKGRRRVRRAGRVGRRRTVQTRSRLRRDEWLLGWENIPPSPSVVLNSPSFDRVDDDQFGKPSSSSAPVKEGLPSVEPALEPQNGVSAPPNPRSSGFVPIATLKRETIQARPLISRDATVVEEAMRVQYIWSSSEKTPVIPAQSMPQFLRDHPPAPAPMSIRTDRRVSPPSAKPPPPDPKTKPLSYSAAARNAWKQDISKAATPPRKVQQSGRIQYAFSPPKPVDPEVKYDIRSARGGRGGKVTAVANLWASGAVNDRESKDKEVPKRLNTVPLRTERKLFSAAVMTPVPPKQVHVTSDSGANVLRPAIANGVKASKQTEVQNVGMYVIYTVNPSPTTNLNPLLDRSGGLHAGKAANQQMLLCKKDQNGHFSTPSSSEPTKFHNLVVKGVKPVIKGASNPVAAVVSSSHAVPTLSTTASLARPAGQASAAQRNARPVKLPTALSAPTVSSGSSPEPPRPVSPSKPPDLAFGQARLRDLIKKYQGQGQKT
ncbi:hypothetical protein CPB84DRAFT_1788037 [Gymnopilus junonius]|uniref:Arrestin-like N-terminal domain-containing protein n=1 Tax=Gymnopilus junonius TaxID=109634 RepID=A0A9P5TJR2_GYMJU|nr:hypothetical protein CPB84DRAFT_1788037 [Gymnopilus junonius]